MADEENKEQSGEEDKVEKEPGTKKKKKEKVKKEVKAKAGEEKREKEKPAAKADKEEMPEVAAVAEGGKEEKVEEEAKTEKEETEAPEEVSEEKATKEAKKGEKEKPLDKMTAIELREIAVEIPGVTGAHAMKKEQLLEVIKEARGIKDEEPAKEGLKAGVSTKAWKKKIYQLKEEKKAARDGRNRKKVAILRRRINRLKKKTRKVAQA